MLAFAILDKKETDSVIIFLHLPKTGGTTLHSIINKQYNIDFNWHLGIRWTADLPIEQKKKLKVLRGHFPFGIHNQLPQKKYTYVTLLRNPIERVISHFYYVRTNKRHELYNKYNQVTLHEFVTKEEFNYVTLNMQTTMLSGSSPNDLELAKNNLKNYFSVVGITERFNETLSVIKNEFGWRVHGYKKVNVTPNRPSIKQIPTETINILKEKNQNDIQLYNFANNLLDEKLKQLKN